MCYILIHYRFPMASHDCALSLCTPILHVGYPFRFVLYINLRKTCQLSDYRLICVKQSCLNAHLFLFHRFHRRLFPLQIRCIHFIPFMMCTVHHCSPLQQHFSFLKRAFSIESVNYSLQHTNETLALYNKE